MFSLPPRERNRKRHNIPFNVVSICLIQPKRRKIMLGKLIKRNSKLFFKDKGMFLTSLITPVILLVLYATFLAGVYTDSFESALPAGLGIDNALIRGTVGAQLISSLLAVSCITVSFCSNLLMVQDKTTGVRKDFEITPVSNATLSLGYFISSALVTLIINFAALGASLIYFSFTGWYLSLYDVLMIALDIIMLVLFGTALSSIVVCRLSTNGQASAVGTIVSAGYGFICGAYMPISNFSEGLQKALMFLPGTYGTSLLRNHALRGVFTEMSSLGFPDEVMKNIRDSIDCNLYFFDSKVGVGTMAVVLIASTIVLTLIYVALAATEKRKKS